MSARKRTDSHVPTPSEGFPVNQWRALLEAATAKTTDGALSMREISAALGCGESRAREIVGAAIKAGTVEFCGRRAATAIDGRIMANMTPLYRLKEA